MALGIKTWTLKRENSGKENIRVIVWQREEDDDEPYYIEIEGIDMIGDGELSVRAALWIAKTLKKAAAFVKEKEA